MDGKDCVRRTSAVPAPLGAWGITMEIWTLGGGSDLLRDTGGIVVWRRVCGAESRVRKTDGHRNAGYDDGDGGGGDGKIRGGCCAFM